MESGSLPAEKFSAFELLRSAFGRLSDLSRGRIWRRRQRSLRVRETLSLGNRGYLAVVSYRQQEFLVGGTTNSIALLAQLANTPAAERDDPEGDAPAR
jgi:flagellar biogenesis protein FliO